MSTSPLKRMERRIKGWFKCIREPVVVDDPPLDLEGDYDELDDCVDEDAFSSNGEEMDEE